MKRQTLLMLKRECLLSKHLLGPFTHSFHHGNDCTSDRCHIRKFKEIYREISKLVVEFKALINKFLFDRKRKNTQWVSNAPTHVQSMMNIHDSYISTSNSSFRVPKTRQIWIMKDVLVELKNKDFLRILPSRKIFRNFPFSIELFVL